MDTAGTGFKRALARDRGAGEAPGSRSRRRPLSRRPRAGRCRVGTMAGGQKRRARGGCGREIFPNGLPSLIVSPASRGLERKLHRIQTRFGLTPRAGRSRFVHHFGRLPNRDRLKTLPADDDQELLRAANAGLRGCGHKTVIAMDASRGLSSAQREKPELILLHVNTPGGKARLLLMRLRRNSLTSGIPVSVVTGTRDAQFPARRRARGRGLRPLGVAPGKPGPRARAGGPAYQLARVARPRSQPGGPVRARCWQQACRFAAVEPRRGRIDPRAIKTVTGDRS